MNSDEYSIKYTKKKQRNKTTPTPLGLFTKKTVVNGDSYDDLEYSEADNDDKNLKLFTKSVDKNKPVTSSPSSTLLGSHNSSPKSNLLNYIFLIKLNSFLILIHVISIKWLVV